MSTQILAIAFLATFCAGSLAWVLIYPYLSGEMEAEKRMLSVARSGAPALKSASRAIKSRREQIENSLKDIESRRQRSRSPPLSVRLTQAGVSWTKQQFWIGSAVFGLVVAGAVFILEGGVFAALALGGAAGAGAPRWVLTYLKKRREARFLDRFPDAIDLVIRGIKSGLPLGDSLRVIASEASEPVKSEFRNVLETPGGRRDARRCMRKTVRAHAARGGEFFRHRRRHPTEERRQPVRGARQSVERAARPQEDEGQDQGDVHGGEASAGIIGALPVAVMLLVYLTSPDYITLLWTEKLGQMMIAGSGLWMLIGIFVMKKMINFDF